MGSELIMSRLEEKMQPSVTAAVLQGTRVSSSDAARAGTGTGMGTGTGTGTSTDVSNGNGNRNGQYQMDLSTETDSVRRTCRTGRLTASEERVEQGDGQRQTDVSNRETDSIRRTCRTERRTASDGRVGQRRAALETRRRNEGIRGNGGNGSKVDIPNRIPEVA